MTYRTLCPVMLGEKFSLALQFSSVTTHITVFRRQGVEHCRKGLRWKNVLGSKMVLWNSPASLMTILPSAEKKTAPGPLANWKARLNHAASYKWQSHRSGFLLRTNPTIKEQRWKAIRGENKFQSGSMCLRKTIYTITALYQETKIWP